VAVVVTTLLAWLLGYQRDEKVLIDAIEAPDLQERVARFNNVVSAAARGAAL
jgi:hypothetical protein